MSGPSDAPLLVLGPSLGTSMAVWEPVLPTLELAFKVLRFDLPGHGASPTELLGDPGPGSTQVEDLASLVLDLVGHCGHEEFHYAGISLGGAIGALIALSHPGRISSLAMVCSSAHFGPAAPWLERAELVRREGTAPLLETSPSRWFADPSTAATPLGRTLTKNLADADPSGYAACCDALARYDIRGNLARISAPTLIIGGTRDVATPPHHARELAEQIRCASLRIVDAGHLAVEQPQAVAEALSAHLLAVLIATGFRG